MHTDDDYLAVEILNRKIGGKFKFILQTFLLRSIRDLNFKISSFLYIIYFLKHIIIQENRK